MKFNVTTRPIHQRQTTGECRYLLTLPWPWPWPHDLGTESWPRYSVFVPVPTKMKILKSWGPNSTDRHTPTYETEHITTPYSRVANMCIFTALWTMKWQPFRILWYYIMHNNGCRKKWGFIVALGSTIGFHLKFHSDATTSAGCATIKPWLQVI